jgi:hypothetical protein
LEGEELRYITPLREHIERQRSDATLVTQAFALGQDPFFQLTTYRK